MALFPGTRLGPYQITGPLGAGGMGEVYKATDTRLDRGVAIKVLPEHVASDPGLRQRFEREARTISSLNHAHICRLYDVGSQDGIEFLVMEFLDGETLAHRLTKGALPLELALRIGIEIADALDKAHRQGIVHRDLKPGNIMLTKEGAKLLDFGLAKLRPPGTAAAMSAAPTVSSPLTGAGSLVGTFQYMAPEQLEGHEADARTDIWAFGAVLYETVTGQKAFEGKSQASLIAAILEREPTPVSVVQPVAPPLLDHLVSRCLAKDPDERWQSAGDVMRELKWLAATGPTRESAVVVKAAGRSFERAALFAALALALLVAAAMAVPTFRHLREATSTPPELRVEINTPFTDDPAALALSPDGTHLVYLASVDGVSQLWLRPLASTTARPLAGTEDARFPFWSPDSRSIGFFTNLEMKRLDLDGGRPQTLVAPVDGRGGTWNADGVILFASATGPLSRVAEKGGDAAPVTTIDPQQRPRYPRFLPSGRQFLFFAGIVQDTLAIYLGSLDSDQIRHLTASDTAGTYLYPGSLVWSQGSTLWAQRLDLDTESLGGDRVMLADRLAVGAAGAFSVSHTGLVAYRTLTGTGSQQLAWFDRTGARLEVLGPSDDHQQLNPRVSPDGRRVAVSRNVQGNRDIWLTDGIRTTRFTSDAASEQMPVWSPDGGRIVFTSDRKGVRGLYIKRADGAGEEELAMESPQPKFVTDWPRDGGFILFDTFDPNPDLAVLPLGGDRRPWALRKTNFSERQAQLSPDGQWVAYQSDDSGQLEVYVRPFGERGSAGSGGHSKVSTAGGVAPTWRSDGTEIYYVAPNGMLIATPVRVQGAVFEPGRPVELFPTRMVGGGGANLGRNYDVARDGRFLINTVHEDASFAPITLLQNWRPPATP